MCRFWYTNSINVSYIFVFILTQFKSNQNKKVKWRPSCLSKLTPIIFNMELTHLGLETLSITFILIWGDEFFLQILWKYLSYCYKVLNLPFCGFIQFFNFTFNAKTNAKKNFLKDFLRENLFSILNITSNCLLKSKGFFVFFLFSFLLCLNISFLFFFSEIYLYIRVGLFTLKLRSPIYI